MKNWCKKTIEIFMLNLDRIIPTVLVVLIAVFGYLFYQESQKYKVAKTTESKGVTENDLIKDGRTIIWAGFSGEYPKFNSKLGSRGLGWAEFPVFRIKETLKKEYGIRIIDRYMTPARLEVEFRNKKYPMCSFPFDWKNPKNEFSKDPKFFYSVPLDLSGEKNLQIIYPKKIHHLFVKHLDEKGDLNIDSLLEDSSIKGTFINDKDYGPKVAKIFSKNEFGDPIVQEKFKKHIKLLVATNNRQLIQMMLGDRFHYTFASLITQEHFKMAKLDPNDFNYSTYDRQVIQSTTDPNLVFSSIRCSFHPVTSKLMPVINELVRQTRGYQFKDEIDKYRFKIDPKSGTRVAGHFSLVSRFRDELTNNKIDSWYPDYYKWIENKYKSEEFKKIITKRLPPIVPSKKIIDDNLYYFSDDSIEVDTFIVLTKSEITHYKSKKEMDQSILSAHRETIFLPSMLNFYLSQNEISFMNKIYEDPNRLKKLNSNSINPKKIIFYARSFKKDDWNMIREKINFNQLEGIKIFFPFCENIGVLLNNVKANLKELAIVSTDLRSFPLASWLKIHATQLESLSLIANYIRHNDLIAIIKNHHASIKNLTLSFQRSGLNDEFSQIFKGLKWNSLQKVNLNHSHIFGSIVRNIVAGLPENLTELDLGNNSILADSIFEVIQKCRKLIKLVINQGKCISKKLGNIDLPNSLEILHFCQCSINADNIDKLIIPKNLKVLNLAGNNLAQLADTYFFKNLIKDKSIQLEKLNLASSKIEQSSLATLLKSSICQKLNSINLSGLGLNDSIGSSLSKIPTISKLMLANNLFSDNLLMTISTNLNKMQDLSLASNYITSNGLKILYSKASKALEALDLSELLEMNSYDLAVFLKKSTIKQLSISNNGLKDHEMELFFSSLPKNLMSFSIDGNFIDGNALNYLSTSISDYLQDITISNLEVNSLDFSQFINSLPESLEFLKIRDSKVTEMKDPLAYNVKFPNNLLQLWLESIHFPKELSLKLIDAIPNNLYFLINANTFLGEMEEYYYSKMKNMKLRFFYLMKDDIDRKLPMVFNQQIQGYVIWGQAGISEFFNNRGKDQEMLDHFAILLNKENVVKFKTSINHTSNLYCMILSGKGINDAFVPGIINFNLKKLNYLWLMGANFTTQGIIKLLEQTPELEDLQLRSSNIQINEVESFIKKIPPSVFKIVITGNKFGEKGKELFLKWKKEQEDKFGFTVDLID